jgi:hypothetical protein
MFETDVVEQNKKGYPSYCSHKIQKAKPEGAQRGHFAERASFVTTLRGIDAGTILVLEWLCKSLNTGTII